MTFVLYFHHATNLQIAELENVEKIIIKLVQHSEFAEKLSKLKQEKPVSKWSKLLTLNPFLDKDRILRVGGRLKHSGLSYGQKYPVIPYFPHLII